MASVLPWVNTMSHALNPGKRHDAIYRGKMSYFLGPLSLILNYCSNSPEYSSRRMQNRGPKILANYGWSIKKWDIYTLHKYWLHLYICIKNRIILLMQIQWSSKLFKKYKSSGIWNCRMLLVSWMLFPFSLLSVLVESFIFFTLVSLLKDQSKM